MPIRKAALTINTGPDGIAAALRSEILRGDIEPGRPMRQDDIAIRFGVSRVPVREALRSLCSEGLAIWQPQRGFSVAILAPDEAREILELRALLETQAIRWAFAHIDEARIAHAETLLDASERTDSIDEWSALNGRFHRALLDPCNRGVLLAMIEQLNNRVDRYIRLLVARADYRRQAEKEHRAILAAADAGDAEATAFLLGRHINNTATWMDDFLARWRPKAPPATAETASRPRRA